MTIRIECRSVSPLLMHSDRASDPLSRDAKWLSEISGKRKKTETDIMELARREFHCSLYLDIAGRPTIPIDNVHSCLYAAARRRKEGPLFSGSFTVSSVKLDYDGPDEPDALWEQQDTFVDRRSVKVATSRVIRTRAIFPNLVSDNRSRARPRCRRPFQHQAVGGDCWLAHRPWRLPAAARRAVRSIRGGGHQKQLTRLKAWQGKSGTADQGRAPRGAVASRR